MFLSLQLMTQQQHLHAQTHPVTLSHSLMQRRGTGRNRARSSGTSAIFHSSSSCSAVPTSPEAQQEGEARSENLQKLVPNIYQKQETGTILAARRRANANQDMEENDQKLQLDQSETKAKTSEMWRNFHLMRLNLNCHQKILKNRLRNFFFTKDKD